MSFRGGQAKFRSFQDARTFAHTLNLTSSEAWTEFCANGERPSDIPSNPQVTYHRDWMGWRDWLGTGQTRNARSERFRFRPFDEARLFARNLGLSSRTEWRSSCLSAERPIDIPTNPNIAYRSRWKGWGDWLGTGNTKNSFLPFEDARPIAQGLGLGSQAEYYAAGRLGVLPPGLPKDPRAAYLFSGWRSWSDWLGTARQSTLEKRQTRRPFPELVNFVRSLGLRSKGDWFRWAKSGRRPEDIPANPADAYKGEGWQTWPHFLGQRIRKREKSSTASSPRRASGPGHNVFNRGMNGKRSRSPADCLQIYLPTHGTFTAVEVGSTLATGWEKVIAILSVRPESS